MSNRRGWTLDKYAEIDLVAKPELRATKIGSFTVLEEREPKTRDKEFHEVGRYKRITIDGEDVVPGDIDKEISCKLEGNEHLACTSVEWNRLIPTEREIKEITKEVKDKEDILTKDKNHVLFPDLGTLHAPELGLVLDFDKYKKSQMNNADIGKKYLVDKITRINWAIFFNDSESIPTDRGSVISSMEWRLNDALKYSKPYKEVQIPTIDSYLLPKKENSLKSMQWAVFIQRVIKSAKVVKRLLDQDETKKILLKNVEKDFDGILDTKTLKGSVQGKVKIVLDTFLLPKMIHETFRYQLPIPERQYTKHDKAWDLYWNQLWMSPWKVFPASTLALVRGQASNLEGIVQVTDHLTGGNSIVERPRSIIVERAMDKNFFLSEEICKRENKFFNHPVKNWKEFTPSSMYEESRAMTERGNANEKRRLESTIWTSAFVDMYVKNRGWVKEAKDFIEEKLTRESL